MMDFYLRRKKKALTELKFRFFKNCFKVFKRNFDLIVEIEVLKTILIEHFVEKQLKLKN